MSRRLWWCAFLAGLPALLLLGLVAGDEWSAGLAQSSAPPDAASVRRGGQLYDAWFTVSGREPPAGNQPLWALQTTNTRTGATTWRCKECHGWDYLGAEGAYGSGSRFTGFAGVLPARLKSEAEIAAILRGSVDPRHDFSEYLGDAEIAQLTAFLRNGLIDMRKLIDYRTRTPIGGDVAAGEGLYARCSGCHGDDGTSLDFGSQGSPEFIGTLAKSNPFEFLHKTLFGQPGVRMPAMYGVFDEKQLVDLLAYGQTLPEK
jgi:thiosulfate dehydrogenase